MQFKNWVKNLNFKKLFKEEDTRFFLGVGLKVSGISFLINCIVFYQIFLVLRLNYGFFLAHGLTPEMDLGSFNSHISSEAMEIFPVMFVFHICLFFIGVYVGWLILRPYRQIGNYCERAIEHPNTPYNVDEFSNFKLLTGFSAFFFEFLRESRKRGELLPQSIPPQYSRIHSPKMDLTFALHFGLLLLIIAISSSVFIIETSDQIFQSLIKLAEKTLNQQKIVNTYFSNQSFILEELVFITISLITMAYTLLGISLYGKVSGAAFGIFSTMRAFMKGAHFSRVHLVGYSYIRNNTRKINKYLDYVQRNLEKNKS
jgi:hypothetical protein